VVADPPTSGSLAFPDGVVRRIEAFAVDGDVVQPCIRDLIEEHPLRIVVNGAPAATLMQTPGNEVALALGFLLTEGLVRRVADVAAITYCREGELGTAGEVQVRLNGEPQPPIQQRYREVFSSCSLCGLELIEAYADDLSTLDRAPGRLRTEDVFALRDAMDGVQALYRQTGGSHAAALAELPVAGDGAVVGEDIGRHNALDKAVGLAAHLGLQFDRCLLMLSGRPSLEMVAKAARAGLSDVAAVGAPSALGVDLARRLGMFLAGFVRGRAMTVYAGIEALA